MVPPNQVKDHGTSVQAILQVKLGIVEANKTVPRDVIRILPLSKCVELAAIHIHKG